MRFGAAIVVAVMLASSCGGANKETSPDVGSASGSESTSTKPAPSTSVSGTTLPAVPPATAPPPSATGPHTGRYSECPADKVLDDHDGDGWGGCTTPTVTTTTTTLPEADQIVANAEILGRIESNDPTADELRSLVANVILTYTGFERVDVVGARVDESGMWLVVAATTGHSTADLQRHLTEDLVQVLAEHLWTRGQFGAGEGPTAVGLDITSDAAHYLISGDAMQQVNEFVLSASDALDHSTA